MLPAVNNRWRRRGGIESSRVQRKSPILMFAFAGAGRTGDLLVKRLTILSGRSTRSVLNPSAALPSKWNAEANLRAGAGELRPLLTAHCWTPRRDSSRARERYSDAACRLLIRLITQHYSGVRAPNSLILHSSTQSLTSGHSSSSFRRRVGVELLPDSSRTRRCV